jgi:hypothetical protein
VPSPVTVHGVCLRLSNSVYREVICVPFLTRARKRSLQNGLRTALGTRIAIGKVGTRLTTLVSTMSQLVYIPSDSPQPHHNKAPAPV